MDSLKKEIKRLLDESVKFADSVKIADLDDTDDTIDTVDTVDTVDTIKTREILDGKKVAPKLIYNEKGRKIGTHNIDIDTVKPQWREEMMGRTVDRSKEAISPDYETHASTADSLSRVKLKVHRLVAKQVDKDGTSIELFAGMGNITNAVMIPNTKKRIVIEKNPKYCEFLRKTFGDKVEIYNMDNQVFMKEKLKDINPDEITCVDFDAFGTAGKTVNMFFDNFKVTRKIGINITDGIGARICYYRFKKEESATELIRLGYDPIDRKGMSISIFGWHLLKRLLERVAAKQNLKLTVVNQDHNRSMTVYCGYILEPKPLIN